MPDTRVLIVEDERSIAEVVGLYMRRAGYQVEMLHNGQAALEALKRQLPDLLILDLMLPEVDGLNITRWLRDHSNIPIIMLTSRGEETDRIAGLEMGADDYVVKPFSPQELVSRVRAVLRRTQASVDTNADDKVLTFGELQIESKTRIVTRAEQEINLTAIEFDLLLYLARHPRQVFTRDQLLEAVWGVSAYIDPSTVTVHIRRLREKIEPDPASPTHLITVWGVGYRFEP